GGGMARAEVEVGGVGELVAARVGGEQAYLGGGVDLLDREPELRCHLARVGHAGEGAPRSPALAESGVGNVDDERRTVRERRRLAAGGADEDEALGALVHGA